MAKRQRPFSLLDVELFQDLPREDWYGADHNPTLPENDEARIDLYTKATSEIISVFEKYDGAFILPILAAMRLLTAHLDQTPNTVLEAETEIAQGFVGKFGRGQEVPSREVVQALAKNIKTHMLLFLDNTSKRVEGPRAEALQRRMSDTLYVRRAYYPVQAYLLEIEIAEEFGLSPVGGSGLTLKEITRCAFYLAARLTASAHAIGAKCEEWLSGSTAPDFTGWLAQYELNPSDIARETAIEEQNVALLLQRWSIDLNSLKGIKLEHLHLENPVWARPLLRDDQKYYGFNPNTFLSFHADVLGAACVGNPTLSERLGRSRGIVLERRLHALLKQLFPHGEVIPNAYWTDQDTAKQHETDAIVLIDEIMFIFEAKGGGIPSRSRRGSSSFLDDVDKLYVASCVQASRLQSAFYSEPGTFDFQVGAQKRSVVRNTVKRVVCFGVALERITTTSLGISSEVASRIRGAGAQPMPVLTIGDLEQVLKLLPTQSERMHYMLRRSELDEEADFFGDELDLIAMYLKTGFTGFAGQGRERIVYPIYGLSDLIRFYQRNEACFDPSVPMPKRTTSTWAALIKSVENGQQRGWTSVVYDLLNAPLSGQEKFEKDIRAACRRCRLTKREGLSTATMQVPYQKHPTLFVALVTAIPDHYRRMIALRYRIEQWRREHVGERILFLSRDGLTFSAQTKFIGYYSPGWIAGRWTAVEGAELH